MGNQWPANRHCENCGQVDPSTDEGYTTCCNELVCYSGPKRLWAIGTIEPRQQTGTTRACCSAEAEKTTTLAVLHRIS